MERNDQQRTCQAIIVEEQSYWLSVLPLVCIHKVASEQKILPLEILKKMSYGRKRRREEEEEEETGKKQKGKVLG